MAEYFLTHQAIEDLSRIWDYTYEVWSESQADKYYTLLIETCQEISRSPDVGKSYEKIDEGILGFRIGKHIIFYRKTKSKAIEILRILHERMDLRNRVHE